MVRAVIDQGLSYRKAAALFYVDPKTVQRWTMDRIAMNMGISRATVCRILQRNGLNRLVALEIKPPPQHYQHENPGDLLHLDIKSSAALSA